MTKEFDPAAIEQQVINGSHATASEPFDAVEMSGQLEACIDAVLGEITSDDSFAEVIEDIYDFGWEKGWVTRKQWMVIRNAAELRELHDQINDVEEHEVQRKERRK